MKYKQMLLPALAALLVFTFFYGVILALNQNRNQQHRLHERNQVRETLNGRQATLEAGLNLRLGLSYSMAAFAVSNRDRLQTTFTPYARQLYDLTPNVRSIQIAPDGILTYIYPLAGNEQAFGLNLATHPDRRASFQRTVRRNTLSLSGPFELVQGGLGLVGQNPILVDGDLWGIGIVVIDIPPLLAEAGIAAVNGRISYAARSINGDGAVSPAFVGDDALFTNSADAILTTIPLPDGYWELAARPTAGWTTTAPESTPILSSGLILALLLSAAAFYVIRTNIDNRRLLSEELHQRQIAQSLQAVAIDLNSNLDEMSLLRNILQQLALVIQYDNSGLFLAENGYLALREGIGFQDTGVSRTPLTEKQSPNARVFNEKRPIMLADARDDPEWQNWTAATAVGAWMGAPLLVNQEAIGILTVHSLTPAIYTPANLHTLQAFADQASTALKNAQLLKETHTAREIAESANRAKSAFLAAMSHELRTPLNGVLGYAQILQQDEQLTNGQRRGLEVIARSGNHLLNLINEVLDLAKIEAGRLELEATPFLLPVLLEDVIAFCDIRARHKGLQFQQTLAKIPTTVRGDAKRLRQILLNVLGNAIKFTEAGQVWLEVKIISDKLPVNPPCAQLCFTITDSGPGIPAAALDSIFEPFQQAGSLMQRSQGTGLGLAISRNLLTLMDSHLYVMSKTAGGDWTTTAPKMPPPPALAHGSRFWFYLCLPLSDADLPDDHPPTRRIIGYKGDPLKILIVDDNADNRAVLTGLLEPLGFLISEAEDGQEGLIKTLAWQPRIILTDLVMPKLDGFSFVRQLRQLPAFADTIIIAASASVLEADVQRSLDIGSNSFLPKPIQAEALYQQLEQLLQLEWIYAGRPSPTSHPAPANMVYPPPTMLRPLHIAALHGNITAVFHQAQAIEQANEALYRPFTDKVRRLAHEFRLDELANWLADK